MRLTEFDSGDAELPLYRVENDAIVLTFLPAVGGRLLSITADGHELLWRSAAHFDENLRVVLPRAAWPAVDGTFASWSNVGGSKTWPAPQGWSGEGEWAGPPDAVLDSGAWRIDSVESAGGVEVTMTSADDPRTGLRIVRRIRLPALGRTFAQHTTFTNVTARPVRWAIWEVAQVDTASGAGRDIDEASVRVSVSAESVSDESVVDLGTYSGVPHFDVVGTETRFAIREGVTKRGFPSATGRMAYVSPSGGLEVAFDPHPGATYPDSGSRAELWMQSPLAAPIAELSGLHPTAWLAELEVLSPLTTIGAGESFSFESWWTVLQA